jgi:hypothetical protein
MIRLKINKSSRSNPAHLIINTKQENKMNIQPLHEVRDQEKLDFLVVSMKKNGWAGRPLLVYDAGNEYQALTGSHRLAASELAEIEPEVEIIDEIECCMEYDCSCNICASLWSLCHGDDDDRLRALKTLHDEGEVSSYVVDLMQQELDQPVPLNHKTQTGKCTN